MRRELAIAALLALCSAAIADDNAAPGTAPGGATTQPAFGRAAFSLPAANIQADHERDFAFGNRLFNTNWVIAPASTVSFDGLGPLFNRVSCSGCHTRDGRGRPPLAPGEELSSMLVRIGRNGKPHPVYGDQIQDKAIPGFKPEARLVIAYDEIAGTYGDGEPFSLLAPRYALTDPGYGPFGPHLELSARVAPAMIGLGLLEAVPDETLLALADPQDRDGDGISGRVNRAESGAIGRFGWKASQPDLRHQNAAAASGDIGLDNPLFPGESVAPELDAGQLAKLTLYSRLLAVPARRGAASPEVARGEALFASIGCAACHLPTLRAGAAELPELAQQTFHPFTDLLLHDMGPGLADNRPDQLADGREWRTPPLWGLGLVPTVNRHDRLLHDGRARGFAEAILWHGGEAEAAKERFRLLPGGDRAALIAFLRSL